jgi:hypothetical protein
MTDIHDRVAHVKQILTATGEDDNLRADLGKLTTPTLATLATLAKCLVGEVSDRDIADVFVAAMEGGSNYWVHEWECPGKGYIDDLLLKGAVFEITEDDRDKATYRIDLARFREGCVKAAVHVGKTLEKFVDNHDAWSGDLALQFACFGEEVYA